MSVMNYSTAIFLANQDVRCVAVTYEKIDVTKDTTKQKYVPAYLSGGKLPEGAVLFKTFDKDISVNDLVIVPTNTRHGFTVCKVVGVDIDVDFDNQDPMHWIVGKVDTAPFERVRQQEEKMIIELRASQKDKRRRELRQDLLGQIDPDAVKRIPMFTAPSDDGDD